MKLVYQTRHGSKRGNCLPACVASLTGLPIEEVDFNCRGKNWLKQYNKKLAQKHGKWLFCVNITDFSFMHGAYIAIGESANSPDCDHAVLWKDNKLFFDPAGKSGKGLKNKPEHFIVVVNYVE
jgi:hypothetical protein